MKEYMNVEDLLKVIHDNVVGRSATFPRGWIRVEDFMELLKKMGEESE